MPCLAPSCSVPMDGAPTSGRFARPFAIRGRRGHTDAPGGAPGATSASPRSSRAPHSGAWSLSSAASWMARRHAARRCGAARKAGGGINTAYIERLNATFRERLASVTRRGRALARRTLTRHHGRYLIGTVSNFCTPPESLRGVGGKQTPAMAAGITDHCWTLQALLSFHVPPPGWTPPKQRGRRSGALQCLMARWCT